MNWHLALWQKITGGLFKAASAQNRIVDLQEKEIAILREKLTVSESKITELVSKVDGLEKELEHLRPPTERVIPVQEQILKFFYHCARPLALDYASSGLRLEYEIVASHVDKLKAEDVGMLRWIGRGSGDWGKGLPLYELTAKGRAYLERNKHV